MREWRQAPWIPLGALEQARAERPWGGREQLFGWLALRWDERYLYLAAQVRDGQVRAYASAAREDCDGITLRIGGKGTSASHQECFFPARFPPSDDLIVLVRRGGNISLAAVAKSGLADLGIAFGARGPYPRLIPCAEPWAASAYLTDGWEAEAEPAPDGAPGPHRRWAITTEAVLQMPLFGRGPWRLRLCAEPATGGPKRMEVWLNGERLSTLPDSGEWLRAQTFEVAVPPGAAREGTNRFILHFPGEPPKEAAPPLRRAAFYAIELLPAQEDETLPRDIAVGDLDGDGGDETCFIAADEGNWQAACLHWRGENSWSLALPPHQGPASLADLDGDGTKELLLRSSHDLMVCGSSPSGAVTRQIRGVPAGLMASADLDGLPGQEIGIASGSTVRAGRISGTGYVVLGETSLPGPCLALVGGRFRHTPNEELCAVVATPGGCSAVFLGLDAEGRLVHREMLELDSDCLLVQGTGQATAGDLDGDGLAELVLLTLRDERASEVSIVRAVPRQLAPRPSSRRLLIPGEVLALRCGRLLGAASGQSPPPGDVAREVPVIRHAGPASWESAPGGECAARRTGRGYDLEARLPWSLLAEARAGDDLPFAVELTDREGGTTLTWPPRNFARLRLLAKALPRDRSALAAEYRRALTAVAVPNNYVLAGEDAMLHVLRGAPSPLLPATREVRLADRRGRILHATRLAETQLGSTAEELSYSVEAWLVRNPGALADGPLRVVAVAEDRTILADTGWQCRAAEYAALREELSRPPFAEARDARGPPPAPTAVDPVLAIRAEYERTTFAAIARHTQRPDLTQMARRLRTIRAAWADPATFREALAQERGQLLRAYRSEVDDSAQPYGLYVPESYTPDRKYPLVVHLHGAGYHPFHGYPPPAVAGCLVLSPHGRDWSDYMYLGEDDVLRCIREVVQRYSVDADRIYLTGNSMGGTGCWHLAAHYPDFFAAIAPAAGNADYRVWDCYWRLPPAQPPPLADLRERMKAVLSPITYAANLRLVPALAVHGTRDRVVYVEHSRHMVTQVRAAGGAVLYREVPGAGHGLPSEAVADRLIWLLSQQRGGPPREVQFSTYEVPAGAYWAGILRKADRLRLATVRARFVAPNRVDVATENVAALALDFKTWRARRPRDWHNRLRDPSFETADQGRPGTAWEAYGLSVGRVAPAWHGRFAARLAAGPTRGSRAELVQRLRGRPQPGERWSFGVWVWANWPPPRAALEIRLHAAGEETPRRIARTPIYASPRWQYVVAEGVIPPTKTADLTFAITLEDGELYCDDAFAGEGGGLPPLDITSDPPAACTSIRTNDGRWEWQPLNLVRDGSFSDFLPEDNGVLRPVAWRIRGAEAEANSDALFGTTSLALTLPESEDACRVWSMPATVDGVAGPLVAGVWGRCEQGQVVLVLAISDDERELAASAPLALSERWQHVEVPLSTPPHGGVRLHLRLAGRGARCLLDGAYLLPQEAVPALLRSASDARLLNPDRPLTVVLNGALAYEGTLPPTGPLLFGDVQTPPPRGPIESAFREPFLVVYGTQGSEREQRMSRRAAEEFAADWHSRYHRPCRMKADREVSEADITAYNLVLYGGPTVNLLSARVNDRLPVRFAGDRIVVGARSFIGPDIGLHLIARNPLNPARAVVVMAGTTWIGLFQINQRFGNWFNWRIYDNRKWYDFAVFDNFSVGPGSFLAFGFLDARDNLSPEMTFWGEEHVRRQIPPRAVPSVEHVPLGFSEFYLSDLMPSAIFQRQGPVGFDRSWEGNPIRLGGRVFPRGLGVRAPSRVEFNIGRQFRYLTTVVGVDLEGTTAVAPERARAERIQFRVHGDDRLMAESRTLRWDSPPQRMVVDVTGVEKLTLEVAIRGSREWLYGSASWGELRLTSARE